MKTLIKNARIISPGIDLPGAAVEIEGTVITAVYPAGSELPAVDKVVDAEGKMLLPGFIDIHSHGAGGCDTCDAKLESLRTIAECKMKEGVTSWLPTTLTLSPKVLENVCATVAEYMKNQEFAKTPGVHLEGPFINPKCCGAQNPAFVRQPDYDEVANLNSIAKVLLVSLAPEMPGAVDFISKASAAGIRCSAGHSAATHEDFNKAKAAGLVHLTHYCNQMSPLHHREIGLVGSGLLDREIKIEIICDTIHLCADMLKTVFKNKETDQMMMITDSLACSWMPDGPRRPRRPAHHREGRRGPPAGIRRPGRQHSQIRPRPEKRTPPDRQAPQRAGQGHLLEPGPIPGTGRPRQDRARLHGGHGPAGR